MPPAAFKNQLINEQQGWSLKYLAQGGKWLVATDNEIRKVPRRGFYAPHRLAYFVLVSCLERLR
jgi:hypothetical protein